MDELTVHSAVNHRYLFEEWLRQQYPDTPILTVSPVDDRYLSPDTSLAWSAWDAAWNTRATSGGDSASLEQRARQHAATLERALHWSSTSKTFGAALRAGIAALANQQGVGNSQAMQSFLDPVFRRAITVAVESAAHYGWSHASWDWESVKGGLDRFGVTQPAGDVGREG